MSSVALLIISILIFVLGYKFYGRKMEQLFEVDPSRQTPAFRKYDGVDYVPAKNWLVLFGHHFASIAGAGPIIGPVMAVCLWGWLPALVWVFFGSIFIGAAHDFGALMISVKEEGASIGDIASSAISKEAKLIFSIFLWLALILVIAVFSYLGASTFVTQPEVVLPSLGLIPVAILVGLALYRFKWNSTAVTIAGLLALAALLFAGTRLPVVLPAPQTTWVIVLLVYCFFASTMPVNLLLQPRDYLSSFLLIAGILLAIAGIFLSHANINAPAFIANKTAVGPLWPMMFITIACGAVSGFHSLIASGTTSKQLGNERDAKRVGFGGMLVEGLVAAIVVILVTAGLTFGEFQQHINAKTSPVNIFGIAFGRITAPITGSWGTFFSLTILNAFILTTLDTATRITRYITEELFGIKNRYLSTGIVIVLGGWLALGKDTAQTPLWQKIWPVFGASNQLVAGLGLLVMTCWLLAKNKPLRYSLIPAIFMLATSLTALVLQLREYFQKGEFILIVVSFLLIGSALFLLKEVLGTFRKHGKFS